MAANAARLTAIVMRPEVDAATIARVRNDLAEFVRGHEGLLLEDKHYALALHYRRAPHLEDEVYRVMEQMRTYLGPTFALQAGKSVVELRPGEWTKGTSITVLHAGSALRGTHASVRRR